MNSQLHAYKKNQINTASSENLVLMLYDGAVKFINRAIKSMNERNIQEANNNLVHAQKIVLQLMSGINFEAGEIAKGLSVLYEYMHHRLVQANMEKETQYAEEVLTMIDELRAAWVQVMKNGYSKDEKNINIKKLRIS